MARSKWISFSAQNALNKDAQKGAQTTVPPLALAEVKKFGLENVRDYLDSIFLTTGSLFLFSLGIHGKATAAGASRPALTHPQLRKLGSAGIVLLYTI